MTSHRIIPKSFKLHNFHFLPKNILLQLTASHQNPIKPVFWLIWIIHICPCITWIIIWNLVWRRQSISLSLISWISFSMRPISMRISVSSRKSEPLLPNSYLLRRFMNHFSSEISLRSRWSPSLSSIIIRIWTVTAVIFIIIISITFIWRIERIIIRWTFIRIVFLWRLITAIRIASMMRESVWLWGIFIKRIGVPIKLIFRLKFAFHHFISTIVAFWAFLILMEKTFGKVSKSDLCPLWRWLMLWQSMHIVWIF